MYAAIQSVLTDTLDAVRRSAPTFLTFAGLLLAGWLAGRLLSSWTRRVVGGILVRMGRTPMVGDALGASHADTMVPRVIGGFVFWVIFLIFVAAAIDTLGLTAITESLSQLALYLPNAFAAIVIVMAGVIAGVLARNGASRWAASASLPRGDLVGRLVQATIVTIAGVVALEQVGVSGRLLVVLVAIVVGTVFAGAAIAFGLGARTAVSNIVASYYVAQNYQPGQRVRIGDAEGTIIRTTPTAVVLDTPEGQRMVPAHRFTEESSLLVTER